MAKKIITVFLILFNLLSMVSFAQTDYDTHWAKEAINKLIESNIISGDGFGVRPDDNITRAELVKIVNRLFGYTDNLEIQFIDVDENKWYANDFKIAKKQGYIKGDENGFANPDSFVTRAEIAVIYARILNLSAPVNPQLFDDDNTFPVWAKDAVYALNRAGLILGYVDSTFRPLNPITRGEVFSLSERMIGLPKGEQTKLDEIISGVAPMAPQASTGGGGGGGGNAGNILPLPLPLTLSTPIIKNVNSVDRTVMWEPVLNAVSYEVTIERITNQSTSTETFTTDKNKVSINDAVNRLMTDKKPTELFTVCVKAIASDSTFNSAPSQKENFKIINPSVKVPEIKVSQTISDDGQEEIALLWDAVENASGYTLFMDFGSGYEPLTVNGTKSVIPYEKLKLVSGIQKIKFQSLSSVPEILDSDYYENTVEIPLYAGREKGRFIILNQRHFENIKHNPEDSFIIKKSIVLNDYSPIEEFKGILTALTDTTVTVNLESSEDYTGLFKQTNGAEISNINVLGTISGTNYVGSIAGNDLGDSYFKDCSNSANITATGNNIGGIVGKISTTGTIEGCTNYAKITTERGIDIGGICGSSVIKGTGKIQTSSNKGEISGYQRVGGIIGLLSSGNNIYSCRNEGKIYASSSNAGGIAGYTQSNIYDSYNAQEISSPGNAGGLAAMAETELTVSNCYNTGKVTSTSNYAGGIFAYLTGSNITITITRVYNTGVISSSKGDDYIGPIYAGLNSERGTSASLSKAYFINTQTFANLNGAISITEQKLKSLNLGTGFAFNIEGSNPYYLYPQIITNPHTTGLDKLPQPPVMLAVNVEPDMSAVITWKNNYKVEFEKLNLRILYNGVEIQGYDNIELNNNVESYIFDDTQTAGTYTVCIKSVNSEGIQSTEIQCEFQILKVHANKEFRTWLGLNRLNKNDITAFEIDN